ncbi:MAG: alpha/beta fold hydrolase [Synergistaceae bacterium]|jgi:hypothetical protein|nr:alpha/beta fold hydrolase [Synergistaceae bacterium]
MILYIHGYQGSPGYKLELVKRVFGDMYANIQAPQLQNTDASADLKLLNGLLPAETGTAATVKHPHLIIGHSLGGFYAWHLCRHRQDDCVCLLINPALTPFISFKKHPAITRVFLKQLFDCFAQVYLQEYESKVWVAYCQDDEEVNHVTTTELILKKPKREKWNENVFFPVPAGGHRFWDEYELERIFLKVKQDIQSNDYFPY